MFARQANFRGRRTVVASSQGVPSGVVRLIGQFEDSPERDTPLHQRPSKEASRTRTACAENTMSTSLFHDASAQYIASVMFALTMLAVGSLRGAWRRRSRQQSPEKPPVSEPGRAESTEPERASSLAAPTQEPDMSSDGRHQVSS